MKDYKKLWEDLKNGIRRDLDSSKEAKYGYDAVEGAYRNGADAQAESILEIMEAMETIG